MIVNSNEFINNQEKYFDIAINEDIFVKKENNMFVISIANRHKEPDIIFEPDEDFYRSISMEELQKRVKEDVHQWYNEQDENNSITGSTNIS